MEQIFDLLEHEHCHVPDDDEPLERWLFESAKQFMPEGAPSVVIVTPFTELQNFNDRIWKENRRVRAAKRSFIERSATDPFTKAHIQPLLQAQEGRCYYCGELLATTDLSAHVHHDHMVPIVYGGTHDVANIVLACRTCNLDKGGWLAAEAFSHQTTKQLTPEQRKIVRRIQASVKRWKEKRSQESSLHFPQNLEQEW
jgi:5-methylcytosine-specific restriction endonuclease McrA